MPSTPNQCRVIDAVSVLGEGDYGHYLNTKKAGVPTPSGYCRGRPRTSRSLRSSARIQGCRSVQASGRRLLLTRLEPIARRMVPHWLR